MEGDSDFGRRCDLVGKDISLVELSPFEREQVLVGGECPYRRGHVFVGGT